MRCRHFFKSDGDGQKRCVDLRTTFNPSDEKVAFEGRIVRQMMGVQTQASQPFWTTHRPFDPTIWNGHHIYRTLDSRYMSVHALLDLLHCPRTMQEGLF